jgi:putative transcriptional regulator
MEPNFRRTVVLVAEHDEEGALGLVLNRPLETEVSEGAPDLVELVPDGDRVHWGGPVQPSGGLVLVDFDDPELAGHLVLGSVGLPGADTESEELLAVARRARVFAGHAGWGPGQLDSELEADGWIVLPAEKEDVFSEDAESLWTVVLERAGGEYALVARMPPDPRMN